MAEHSTPLDMTSVRRAVEAALEEDGAARDITTQALVTADQRGSGAIIAKAGGVLCGLPVAQAVFSTLDPTLSFQAKVPEGSAVSAGTAVASVYGPLASVLSGERVALNFLQRLSGVATATRECVDAVAGLPVRIVDTRKTTPGLRTLERYAVRVGGGHNHRFNLADAVLIKDNHIAAASARGLSIAQVVERARNAASHTARIEIEAASVAQAREAADAGVDVILLDNMSVKDLRAAIKAIDGRALVEASGSVTAKTVRRIAQTGVDIISTGSITHSATALDMSLDVEG